MHVYIKKTMCIKIQRKYNPPGFIVVNAGASSQMENVARPTKLQYSKAIFTFASTIAASTAFTTTI